MQLPKTLRDGWEWLLYADNGQPAPLSPQKSCQLRISDTRPASERYSRAANTSTTLTGASLCALLPTNTNLLPRWARHRTQQNVTQRQVQLSSEKKKEMFVYQSEIHRNLYDNHNFRHAHAFVPHYTSCDYSWAITMIQRERNWKVT